jgi:hypothetical protein
MKCHSSEIELSAALSPGDSEKVRDMRHFILLKINPYTSYHIRIMTQNSKLTLRHKAGFSPYARK